jgi:hypothetical protein
LTYCAKDKQFKSGADLLVKTLISNLLTAITNRKVDGSMSRTSLQPTDAGVSRVIRVFAEPVIVQFTLRACAANAEDRIQLVWR